MNKDTVVSGIAGGLAGGVVFGILMGAMGMLPMVAKLVGSSSPIVGFIVHLGISAVIGAGYGLLVANRLPTLGASLSGGLGYGILWWILGPLTLMPLFMGMGLGVNWNLEAARQMAPSLVGHILFGLVLAAMYLQVKHRVPTSCKC